MSESEGRYRVSVDIGGTFTDLLILDENRQLCHVGKVFTAAGFRDALEIGTEGLYDIYDLGLVNPATPPIAGVVSCTRLLVSGAT